MSNRNPLPSIWRFDLGDYTGLGPVFQKFLANLNLFTLAVYNLMNGGIGFANLQRSPYSLKIIGGKVASFVNPLPIAPTGITVIQVSPAPASAVDVSGWSYNGQTITVTPLGLTSATSYTMVMEVF